MDKYRNVCTLKYMIMIICSLAISALGALIGINVEISLTSFLVMFSLIITTLLAPKGIPKMISFILMMFSFGYGFSCGNEYNLDKIILIIRSIITFVALISLQCGDVLDGFGGAIFCIASTLIVAFIVGRDALKINEWVITFLLSMYLSYRMCSFRHIFDEYKYSNMNIFDILDDVIKVFLFE